MSHKKIMLIAITVLFFNRNALAQSKIASSDSAKFHISIESDPAFWVGTLPNGLGFDANLDFKFKKIPHFRFGVLAYSGKWSGEFGKSILLTKGFIENDWQTQWNGLGIETQYQFRLGLRRGGLQPGLRLQWNQFQYNQSNIRKAEANHFVITPQVGFQLFPFKKWGLYFLPWAGVQLPIAGTNSILVNGENRDSRKVMPVFTAHIGWEFNF